ncbi:hypothetical protein K469DRAFT_717555 [Zopfia rhizophila CBS 207.26]|uniref:Uncharacterized protein n=1 Tax=Zopfia rhizophila CBS 207.26 TaxID=1314779 RepID=A0A6A6DM69_9PEZI|nr:hypothetical protein K469DRAFT_717555 [Zopfia rhizophila CBS 207.26]
MLSRFTAHTQDPAHKRAGHGRREQPSFSQASGRRGAGTTTTERTTTARATRRCPTSSRKRSEE